MKKLQGSEDKEVLYVLRALIVILWAILRLKFNAVNFKNATDILFDQVKGLRLGADYYVRNR